MQRSVLVHQPEGCYGVFDAAHRLVRIGRGRLLGGWHSHLTVLRDDQLYRDDTVTGESVSLAAVEGPVDSHGNRFS